MFHNKCRVFVYGRALLDLVVLASMFIRLAALLLFQRVYHEGG